MFMNYAKLYADEVGDGVFRDIGPGDVRHMEDKHGKGHHTKVTSDSDFLSVIIQFE